jgi:hypothetical protein
MEECALPCSQTLMSIWRSGRTQGIGLRASLTFGPVSRKSRGLGTWVLLCYLSQERRLPDRCLKCEQELTVPSQRIRLERRKLSSDLGLDGAAWHWSQGSPAKTRVVFSALPPQSKSRQHNSYLIFPELPATPTSHNCKFHHRSVSTTTSGHRHSLPPCHTVTVVWLSNISLRHILSPPAVLSLPEDMAGPSVC